MALDPVSAAREYSSGKIKPVYLFKGPEHFLHRYLINKIETELNSQGAVSKRIIIPDELEEGQLMDMLNTSDLFSSRKLLILFYPLKLKGKIQKEFLSYCENPNDQHTLVIISDDFYKKTKFLSALEKIVKPLDMRTPFGSDLKKWANVLFKEKNISVTSEAISQLVHYFGDSIYHIANEIDKICIEFSGSGSITGKDLLENQMWRRSYQNWEFLDVVARKKLNDALIRGKSFFDSAPDFSIVMNIIIIYFTSLYYLKISNGTFLSNIGSIPLSPYVKKRLPVGAKYYSLDEIEKIIHYLASLDRKLKTTTINHESAFTKFLFHAIS
jgi:DNA polymerase III delta subunit